VPWMHSLTGAHPRMAGAETVPVRTTMAQLGQADRTRTATLPGLALAPVLPHSQGLHSRGQQPSRHRVRETSGQIAPHAGEHLGGQRRGGGEGGREGTCAASTSGMSQRRRLLGSARRRALASYRKPPRCATAPTCGAQQPRTASAAPSSSAQPQRRPAACTAATAAPAARTASAARPAACLRQAGSDWTRDIARRRPTTGPRSTATAGAPGACVHARLCPPAPAGARPPLPVWRPMR